MRTSTFTRVALALMSAVLSAATPAQVAPPRDARNASFWKRVDNPAPDPLQPPRSSYQPLGTIAGAPGPFLPQVGPSVPTTIAAQALDEAWQFALANNSQALIVVHKGVVQLERYAPGADAAAQFSSHSFAKTLVAMAIGAAIDDGRIASLDQPAGTWLPEWRDAARQAITLRQLLAMSGGFRNAPTNDPASHYMQLHYGADVQAIVRDAPVAYPPGSDFAYDNDNLQALGLVIERATGVPYADYVSRRLWQRVGAGDAEVLYDRSPADGGRAMPYCCIWSAPRDWVRLGQMLLDGGVWQGQRVLSQAFVDAMRQPSAANANFGLQLSLGAAWMDPRLNRRADAQQASLAPAAAPDLAYLSGAGGLMMAIVPSDQLVVLRVGKNAPGWREHVLPNLLHAALQANSTASKGTAAADWAWLYDWRLSTRPTVGNPWVFEPTRPQFWPVETVVGGHAPPLPRRTTGCLTDAALAPALAELERVKSYGFLVWRDGAIEVEHYWPGATAGMNAGGNAGPNAGPNAGTNASPNASTNAAQNTAATVATNVATGTDIGADTRAESASMHKSVLGLLVGQAVADGFIPSLDAPVSRWLTEWGGGDPRGAITVRQLMQMASGLAPIKFDMTPGAPNSRFLMGADANAVPLASTLADAPGSRFNYGSSISQLLGLIVQRASGQRYAQYLSQRLWQPLGAADAAVALDRPGGMARTSGSLLARADDWLRLGLLFIDRGRVGGRQVVSADWLDAMAAPSPANPNYGLQLWRGSPHAPLRSYNSATTATVPAKQPFLADDMLYFDGAGAQRVYIAPRDKLVIVRTGAPAADWDDSLVPNIVTAAARACKGAR